MCRSENKSAVNEFQFLLFRKRKIKQQKHKNDKMREEKEKRRAAFDGQKGRPPKKEENVKEIDKKKSLKSECSGTFRRRKILFPTKM